MTVCLTTEERFLRTPDGQFWTQGGASYSFLRRYLGVFCEIRVVARVRDVRSATASWKRSDGPGVTFAPVPNYVGPLDYLRQFRDVSKAVRNTIGTRDAIILRAGQLSSSVGPLLKTGRPFGLEVIGDPYHVFAPGTTNHVLRPFWRWWFTRQLRGQCASACAVCYVTGTFLQKNYPPAAMALCTSFINMEMGDEAFAEAPTRFATEPSRVRIVTVGALEQPYKGVDVLIDAVNMCATQGHRLELFVIGEGRCRKDLEQYARVQGADNFVTFLGAVPNGQGVREELDRAGLFILASKTEGLPRALVEAMARGLPCIGTTVGGIPELLHPEDLVPAGDATALAAKICEVIDDPVRLSRMSARNLDRARDYSDPILDAKRQDFLEYLLKETKAWVGGRSSRQGRTKETACAYCRL